MSYSQYFGARISQLLPNTSIINTTTPTFSGITSVTPNGDGSFTVSWSAATGSAATPFHYQVYVALGSVSAAALFVDSNWIETSPDAKLSVNVFQLGDQSTYYVNGQTYTFGVRAVSANSIVDTNVITSTAVSVSSGNLYALIEAIKAKTDNLPVDPASQSVTDGVIFAST